MKPGNIAPFVPTTSSLHRAESMPGRRAASPPGGAECVGDWKSMRSLNLSRNGWLGAALHRPGLAYADPPPAAMSTPMAGALAIEWEDFARHMNTSDVGRVIQDIEKKLEAVEGPPPIRIMDCDPSLMSDLYGMSGLKFEPAYKTNSGIAMLNRLRVAVLEGKVRVHPKMRQS